MGLPVQAGFLPESLVFGNRALKQTVAHRERSANH